MIDTLDILLESVALILRVPLDLVKNGSQKKEVVHVRRLFCYIAKKHPDYAQYDYALATIGSRVGRGHATAIHHIGKMEFFLTQPKDPAYHAYHKVLERLEDKVRQVSEKYRGVSASENRTIRDMITLLNGLFIKPLRKPEEEVIKRVLTILYSNKDNIMLTPYEASLVLECLPEEQKYFNLKTRLNDTIKNSPDQD